MAGVNTAVFGIFQSRVKAEECVDLLLSNGFRGDDVSVLAPDQQSTKSWRRRKTPKLRKEQPPAQRPEARLAERLDYWRGLALLRYRVLDLLSRLAQSWGLWPELAREQPQAV